MFEQKLHSRKNYLDRIRPFINQPIIKILTGQRRVGKSYMLKLLIQELEESLENNIIYIDKERESFSQIISNEDLYKYVLENLRKDKNNYLFIDEVQEIKDFQKALRSLLNEGLCDIFCTGSNAHILSGDLATILAGRYMEFPVYSLSYKEFLDFHNLKEDEQAIRQYLSIGGLPYLHHLGTDPVLANEYLKNVYASILLKDVVKRANIRNVALLENLVRFLADNIGSLFTAQNISKYLKSQKINMPTQTIINYLEALSDAYFIHKVQRMEVQGLKIFEIKDKYYFDDLGLRNSVAGLNYARDISKLIENIVFMHLKREGFLVFVGKDDDKEIDFIATKNNERIYVQVTYLLSNEKTIEREFGNLINIKDNYPKYVVSMDSFTQGNSYQGIHHLSLRSFLMMEWN